MATLAEIRAQYPEYSDVDDKTLADKLHAKFYADMPRQEFDRKLGLGAPSWSEVPGQAISNLPESAGRFVGGIVDAVTSPLETGKNLLDAAAGGTRRAAQAVLPQGAFEYLESFNGPRVGEATAKADAVGQFYKDRYGSGEALRTTLATDPVGAAADAATVLTGGGAAVSRVPGLQAAGNVVSRAGAYVDPVRVAGRAAAVGGNAAAHALGVTTGAGAQPVQAAFQAGRTGNQSFPAHMRGQAPMEQVIDMADDAMGHLRRNRSAAYDAGMQTTRASQAAIDYMPVHQSVARAFDDITYNGVAKDQASFAVLQEIGDLVQRFEQMPNGVGQVPAGFDALKQAIGEVRQRTQPGTMARRTADQVYNSVRSEIARQVPEYANTMRDYAAASDQLNELQRTFSLTERAAPDTTLRKLQSTMRNNVNTNYGRRTRLLDELAQYQPDLPYALAGQAMSSATPRGLQGVTAGGTGIAGLTSNPAALAALPAFSPRVVGEGAYAVGRGAQLADNLTARLGGPENIARAILAAYATGQVTSPAAEASLERALDEAMRRRKN